MRRGEARGKRQKQNRIVTARQLNELPAGASLEDVTGRVWLKLPGSAGAPPRGGLWQRQHVNSAGGTLRYGVELVPFARFVCWEVQV